jgi:hypothetical protein
MGAVDSSAIHALLDEIRDQLIVVGSFTRHGDQDSRGTPRAQRAQEGQRVGLQNRSALPETDRRLGSARISITGHHVQVVDNSFERGYDVFFSPTK